MKYLIEVLDEEESVTTQHGPFCSSHQALSALRKRGWKKDRLDGLWFKSGHAHLTAEVVPLRSIAAL